MALYTPFDCQINTTWMQGRFSVLLFFMSGYAFFQSMTSLNITKINKKKFKSFDGKQCKLLRKI